MTATALKRIRREFGLTQEALAAAVGVARETVARWETGVHGIPEPTVRLIHRIRAERRGARRPDKGSKRRA